MGWSAPVLDKGSISRDVHSPESERDASSLPVPCRAGSSPLECTSGHQPVDGRATLVSQGGNGHSNELVELVEQHAVRSRRVERGAIGRLQAEPSSTSEDHWSSAGGLPIGSELLEHGGVHVDHDEGCVSSKPSSNLSSPKKSRDFFCERRNASSEACAIETVGITPDERSHHSGDEGVHHFGTDLSVSPRAAAYER